MKYGISHSFDDETLLAKAEWFFQKPIDERLREALEDMVFVNGIAHFEGPDDRIAFKTFRVFERRKVECLLIGGMLAITYGVPRVTRDIDLFINPTKDNANAILAALKKMGMDTAEFSSADDICSTEVTIFKDFVRLDILTAVKGLNFSEAWKNKEYLSLQNTDIPSLGLDDLIKSKKASNRPPDIGEIKILEMARTKTK